ncbi:hypothetical protein F5Y15DRAFT_347320 [Xylariaceae sp. FL0016]|nr:hypothetical protein F5Y15DRAFT_347320 [Xylariaceae sp. FL0016]
MSNYSGRRGPPVNVSQLLENLNRVNEPQPPPEEHPRTLDEELSIFTNTNFLDWDASHDHENGQPQRHQQPPPPQQKEPMTMNLATPSTTSPAEAVSSDTIGELSSFDFNLSGDFNGFDFHSYPASNVSTFPDSMGNLQPIQPSPIYSPNGTQQNSYGSQMHQAGEKRKAEAIVPQRRQMSLEEQSRVAAEEDKRRRNTAASARFRVKKKAREQALEKREKELGDKVSALEVRIQSLETENKWLRELVMEKTGGGESILTSLLDKRKTESEDKSKKEKAEKAS